MTTETIGRFATPKASQYMQTLAKHFAHKIEVSFTETEASIAFPAGTVRLEAAGDLMTARYETDDEETRARLASVIDRHLARFAFREGFERMDWKPPLPEPAESSGEN